jgi:hypothetical protein
MVGLKMMEMPTPCPTCERIVELNDMNTCNTCRELYCDSCLPRPWEDCENCKLVSEEEDDGE